MLEPTGSFERSGFMKTLNGEKILCGNFSSPEAKFFTAPGTAEALHLQSTEQILKSLTKMSGRMKCLSWLVRDQQMKTNMAFGPHC